MTKKIKLFIFNRLFRSNVEQMLKVQRDKCAATANKYYLSNIWDRSENAILLFNEVNATKLIDIENYV